MVSRTPRTHFIPRKDPVPIVQEAGWAPGPVWTGGKSRPHRDSIPDRPARSSVAISTELLGQLIKWVNSQIPNSEDHVSLQRSPRGICGLQNDSEATLSSGFPVGTSTS